jgi:hypothetical protein
MRQLTILLTISFVALFANAQSGARIHNDSKVLAETAMLKSQLRMERNPQARAALFLNFGDRLFQHLQTIPLPQPGNEAQEEQFALLNQFQADIEMIHVDQITQETCIQNDQKLRANAAIPANENTAQALTIDPTTKEVLEILQLICGSGN